MKLALYPACLILFALGASARANHVLTAGDLNASFDFNDYRGAGFALTPAAGQLSTEAYVVSGFFPDDRVFFGGTATSGDFARGISADSIGGGTGATVGGAYAFNRGGGNYAVGFQPTGTDFNPGAFYVNIINNTGFTISSFAISSGVVVYNDAAAASTLNFSYAAASVDTTAATGTDPLSLSYTAVPVRHCQAGRGR